MIIFDSTELNLEKCVHLKGYVWVNQGKGVLNI